MKRLAHRQGVVLAVREPRSLRSATADDVGGQRPRDPRTRANLYLAGTKQAKVRDCFGNLCYFPEPHKQRIRSKRVGIRHPGAEGEMDNGEKTGREGGTAPAP